MKTDLNLSQLVAKVNELSALKRDFCLNADELKVKSDYHHSYLNIGGVPYAIHNIAEHQLSAICGIPYSYIQHLKYRYPDLIDINYNTALRDINKKKLIRTLGGQARAILSDRYKRFENETVLKTLIPLIEDTSGLSVVSSSITSERMYVKVVSDREKADVKVGDTVQFGAVITNSEVGMGSITVIPFCLRLVCTNGLALPQYTGSSRRIHLGKKFSCIEEYEENTPDENVIFAQLKEQLTSSLDSIHYRKVIEKMKMATEIAIPDPRDTLERIAKRYSLSEEEQNRVLNHFIIDNDITLYGLVNAVTRSAQDASSYIRASELERLGSDILYDGISTFNRSIDSSAFGLLAG